MMNPLYLMSLINQLNQFRQNNPNMNSQMAQQQVQQLRNNGKMSEEQFNQYAGIANQIMAMMGIHR